MAAGTRGIEKAICKIKWDFIG